MQEKPYVGVVGSGTCDRSSRAYQLALEVGRLIAQKGGTLICGGLYGVMEAAARGAKQAGGTTVGILPGRQRSEQNAYLDVSIATGMGDARNLVNVLSSDVIIAISGGPGTLSEIALALKNGKHVVGLETWHFDAPDFDTSALYVAAGSPSEAVEKAFERAGNH